MVRNLRCVVTVCDMWCARVGTSPAEYLWLVKWFCMVVCVRAPCCNRMCKCSAPIRGSQSQAHSTGVFTGPLCVSLLRGIYRQWAVSGE